MVFKLVRVDSTEPCKIKLPVGKHDIGRGKFLFENDDYDHKVSRNHAELLVTDDEVKLTALHFNPCFYMLKQQKNIQILNKDSSIVLGCGDKFGILPHIYWYELIFCSQLPEDAEPKDITEESDPVVNEEDDMSNEVKFDLNATEQVERSSSPSSLLERDSSTQLYEWRKTPTPEDLEDQENKAVKAESPLKRPATPVNADEGDSKKAKIADDDADGAGPSNQASTSDVKADDNTVRERCMYGASCYRKNPQHKAQYSHPADPDWAAGGATACQWGAACRRRDPRHRRDYTHPPHAPHAHVQRDQRGRKRSDDTALILTGKRERKTLKRDVWSGSESEGEKDPYATDESDEWQPSSDLTDTQGLTPDWN